MPIVTGRRRRWPLGRRLDRSQPPVAPSVSGVRSDEVAELLDREGYARLDGFLTAEEVARAQAVFDEAMDRLDRDLGDAWFPTVLLPEDDIRAFITTELRSMIEPKLHRVLVPGLQEVMRLDYSVKPASTQSELGPHQDFSVIDEDRHRSLYLWMPLCDTDELNGTLHLVPRSHRFANRIRSRHVPATFDDVFDLVHERAVRLDCRAGDLVVMVSGVIHYSPPNRSEHLRLAAHGIVKPVDAPLVFFYADDETPAGKVECYELDIERYVHYIHHGRPDPDIALTKLVDRPPERMTRKRFLEHFDTSTP